MLQVLLLLLLLPLCSWAIVNPSNSTANMVIYMLPEQDLGPAIWQVGVECLDQFAQIFFHRNPLERYTRSYNIMLGYVYNMTSPTDQILWGYSKRLNEAISQPSSSPPRDDLFQLRVVSDQERSALQPTGELVLADNYVIVVDSLARLRRLMERYISQTRSWNPGARFLVLFHSERLRNKPLTVATQIFNELMHSFYVHRVALVYAIAADGYQLLVNDYYSNVDCRILNVQSVGQCQNGSLVPDTASVYEAMKDYIRGFSPTNCTFYVCAAISAPFVEADCVLGLEMRILGFMQNRLNFKTNQSCLSESRGEMDNASGNWSGLLGKLTDGECDFIVGGFYPDNEVFDNFWTSDCYMQDAHTWFVHLAERRPFWRAMLAIFLPATWLGFLLILIISALFWYALNVILPEPKSQKQLSLAGINSLAVTLGVAVNERPTCESTKVFYIAFNLYAINMVATYTSKMISTFQDPGYMEQLDYLEQVVAAGIPFGGYEESRDWFENDEDYWIFKDYNYSQEFKPSIENLRYVEQGARCILSNRMYMLQNQYADDIYALRDNVFSSPLQMIMKAGFPFLYEMNQIIRYMRDIGIFQKIDADFRYNNTYLNRIAKMRPKFAATAIVLTTQHFKGPFGILIVGICCSLLMFIAELLCGGFVTRCQQRRRRRQRQQRRTKRKLRRQQLRQQHVSPVVPIRFTPLKRRKVLQTNPER